MSLSHTRKRRLGIAALGFVLLTSACGLKEDTLATLQSGGGARVIAGGVGAGTGTTTTAVDPTTGETVVLDESGQVVGTVGEDGTVTPTDGGTGTDPAAGGGDPAAGGGTDGSAGGEAPAAAGGGGAAPAPGGAAAPPASGGGGGAAPPASGGGGGAAPVKGTTTGITADKILIGIHAPLTGASPLPQASFESGKNLYFKGKKFFGRTVEVEILDDTYTPSGAISACEKMARKDFIVVGGAGTDQIQACARNRLLATTSTPYLSAGVTTNGLTDLPNYYALSLTYAQQAKLVVDNAKAQGFGKSGEKWALVLSDTPNFTDAKVSMEKALQAAGIPFKYFKVSKAGTDSEAAALANDLRTFGAGTVYFLGQPTFFIKVVSQTAPYSPVWTGVGISMGLNAVSGPACAGTANRFDGRFLSPYPGLNTSPADFRKAGGKDDIELNLYGATQLIGQALQALEASGGPLTREAFLSQLGKSKLAAGAWAPVDFKGGHFGGTGAYSLKSNCAGGRVYDTVTSVGSNGLLR